MDEQNKEAKSNNKIWIWIIVAVIVLLVLFFIFKGGKKEEGGTTTGGAGAENTDIDSLAVGDNPDTGVDDFGTLDVSEEDIFP